MDWTKSQTLGPWLLVGLAGLVPWLTWWGVTNPNPHQAVADTPIFLAGIGFLLVLCVWIGHADLCLALFAGYVVVRVFPLTSPYAWEAAYVTVLGAFGLTVLSTIPARWIARCRGVLLAGGVCQVGYGVVQWWGYDPIWLGTALSQDPGYYVRGTLGNSNYFGTYSAVLLLCSPVWLMPVFVVGLLLSKSVLAVMAIAIGLAVRYRQYVVSRVLVVAGLAGAVWYASLHRLSSLEHRTDVWAYAIKDWLAHPVLGWGTGQWPFRIPVAQVTDDTISVHKEVFVQAHNEYLQVLYDGGLIGLVLVTVWCWAHRGLWRGPSAGMMMGLAVLCVGTFPFHVGTTGLLALALLGVAMAEERMSYATSTENAGHLGLCAGPGGRPHGLPVGHVAGRQPTL